MTVQEASSSGEDPRGRQSRAPVVAALFSVTGSVGKSQIALALYENRLRAGAPLLVDADLVAGTLSLAAVTKGFFGKQEIDEWTFQTVTSATLLESEVDIPPVLGNTKRKRTFLPAAQWVLLSAAIKNSEDLERKNLPVTPADLPALLRAIDARSGFKAALDMAQEQQARFNSDLPAQRRFWRSVLNFANDHQRDVIVDLPAQGPSGVAVARNWKHICEEARDVRKKQPGNSKGPVTLRRILVFTSSDHPMVEHFRNEQADDIILLRNMVPVPAEGDKKEPADAPSCLEIYLSDVGGKAVTPSPHHDLMKGNIGIYGNFQQFVDGVAYNLFDSPS